MCKVKGFLAVAIILMLIGPVAAMAAESSATSVGTRTPDLHWEIGVGFSKVELPIWDGKSHNSVLFNYYPTPEPISFPGVMKTKVITALIDDGEIPGDNYVLGYLWGIKHKRVSLYAGPAFTLERISSVDGKDYISSDRWAFRPAGCIRARYRFNDRWSTIGSCVVDNRKKDVNWQMTYAF